MRKTLTRVALLVLAVLALGTGHRLGDVVVGAYYDFQFQQEVREDPRYAVVRQVEEECPGVYVVDVSTSELGGERTAVYVMVTFDRRVTKEMDSTPDELTGESDLDRYIARSRAAIIRAADAHMDFDVLGVGLLYIGRQPVLGGEAWVALVILLNAGEREDMLAWAEGGATDYELARSSVIYHYGYSPFEPHYHYEYLRRPASEGPPLWEVLEALEAE